MSYLFLAVNQSIHFSLHVKLKVPSQKKGTKQYISLLIWRRYTFCTCSVYKLPLNVHVVYLLNLYCKKKNNLILFFMYFK